MKKLFAAFCITLCLLFSGAAGYGTGGDGHDGGCYCTETADCPPDNPMTQASAGFDVRFNRRGDNRRRFDLYFTGIDYPAASIKINRA